MLQRDRSGKLREINRVQIEKDLFKACAEMAGGSRKVGPILEEEIRRWLEERREQRGKV